MWMPDRDEGPPIYQQIADHIAQQISNGEFPPGSLLPSERKLADRFGVNRSTIVLAYSELRSLGIIISRPGSGTRVNPIHWSSEHHINWGQFVENGHFSPTPAFIRRINEALRHDQNLIDFASGELSQQLSAADELTLIMNYSSHTQHLGYDNPQGFEPLREAVAQLLQEHQQIHTTSSSLLITSGSQQSLYLITHFLLSPGDAVAIEEPSYYYSLPMFHSAGLRVYKLPAGPNGLNPDEVRRLYKKHRIKMLFINPFFQNPTGSCLLQEHRTALLNLAGELGLPIVEDDPYSLTSFDSNVPRSLKSVDTVGSVLYISSLSKIAAAGLRIGWLAAPSSVIDRLAEARQQMDFGHSIVTEAVASQFIASTYFLPHIQRLRIQLQYKRDMLIEALNKELHGLISFDVPSGGIHLWCKIIPSFQEHKLLEEAIRQGVVYVPGSVYGSDPSYVRFTFARPASEQIATGISKFAAALRTVIS